MSDRIQSTEKRPVDGAQLSDLNLNLVREHIDTAIRRRGYDGPTEPEGYLRRHSCLMVNEQGVEVPTLAGILSFGREPHNFASICGIDIAQFSGARPNSTQLIESTSCGNHAIYEPLHFIRVLCATPARRSSTGLSERSLPP